jgi:hypothetical protein
VRLTELDATFIAVGETPGGMRTLPDARGAQGVRFDCPHCGCWLVAWFRNPVGAPVAPPDYVPVPRWERSGETLDTLTLRPSIDARDHWHGFVTNGDVR